MHQTLRIPEILLNIFGHCLNPTECYNNNFSNLAVLARTCQTFKEPALDVLWEELYDTSPLARCLPEASSLVEPTQPWDPPCYSFIRPLKEAEWSILRGYTRRVWFMHCSFSYLDEDTLKYILSLAPFDGPLFPHLRSLYWNGPALFALLQVAVPSLTTHSFAPFILPHQTIEEFLDVFGDRCPNLENLLVHHSFYPMDSMISHAICRWPKLQKMIGSNIALSMDAILHLSSVSNLKQLYFTMKSHLIPEISRLNSKLVFSSLTNLDVRSIHLDTITSLLRTIRLPAIESLSVITEGKISSRTIQEYWAAVREGCLSSNLAYLKFYGGTLVDEDEVPSDEEELPCLTIDDLRPCTVFSELRGLDFDLYCPVQLTDTGLLELVSPRMEYFLIDHQGSWDTDDRGITLSGLVQLLRQCPLIEHLSLSIDTQTFTEIPEGLDISFPPRRQLKINLVDTYILPEFVPGMASVFMALGLDPFMLRACEVDCDAEVPAMWKHRLNKVRSGS